MGIYVGWSLSHAAKVSLILNPRTGHISPQFHIVYEDDFTTVPYFCTATVPPHWAELVVSSATIEFYTQKQISTWQLLPEINVESGDFTSDSFIQSTVVTTSEGDEYSEEARNLHVIDAHNKNIVSNQVTFSDERDSEIQSMCLDILIGSWGRRSMAVAGEVTRHS
jgi:hypothetical protein